VISVQDLFSQSVLLLSKNQAESVSRFEVESVFMDVFECTKTEFLLGFRDFVMDADKLSLLNRYVRELSLNKPLGYVLGKVAFLDDVFVVSEGVLIPRPETEELVHLVTETVKDMTNFVFVECGFGSGCIALSLGKRFPGSEVFAWDVSEDAYGVALKNRELLGLSNVTFYLGDFFEGFDKFLKAFGNDKQMVLVSNPPYISDEEMSRLDPSVFEYEPKLALTDDGDGLSFYRGLAELNDDRIVGVFCEFGESQGGDVASIFGDGARVVKDMNGKDRFVTLTPSPSLF
jgi:release factor glutamine methyltransferase